MQRWFTSTTARRLGLLLVLSAALSTTISVTGARAAAEIAVTTTAQGIDFDGDCSLQEAIFAANRDSNVVPPQKGESGSITTACAPGSGVDTITLPAGGSFALKSVVDDFANHVGPTATPMVTSPVVIEARGSRLYHDGGPVPFRAFGDVETASRWMAPLLAPSGVEWSGESLAQAVAAAYARSRHS